uniref:Uncharacterized protein n=1 Tax=Fagus sylvatica TaxID=28930 RepID=A0A2N9IIG5_FAGSY
MDRDSAAWTGRRTRSATSAPTTRSSSTWCFLSLSAPTSAPPE